MKNEKRIKWPQLKLLATPTRKGIPISLQLSLSRNCFHVSSSFSHIIKYFVRHKFDRVLHFCSLIENSAF